jgi:hypothetical protein
MVDAHGYVMRVAGGVEYVTSLAGPRLVAAVFRPSF